MSESLPNQPSHTPSIVENPPKQAIGLPTAPPTISEPVKRGRGRPKGSKNKPKVCTCSAIYSKLTLSKISPANLLEPDDDLHLRPSKKSRTDTEHSGGSEGPITGD